MLGWCGGPYGAPALDAGTKIWIILKKTSTFVFGLPKLTDMLDWDDFEEQEFDEEELRLQKERQRREQEQSQNRYA